MYITVETNRHLFIPLAYNRVLKRRKHGVPVHGAGVEAEIHRIAYQFPTKYLTIPNVYEVVDTKSYIMDSVFIDDGVPDYLSGRTHSTEICNELIDFANYMIDEGYFPYGFTVFLTTPKPLLFDFSMFGIIDKDTVRFPNIHEHHERFVKERRLFHYVIGYKSTLSEKIDSGDESEVTPGVYSLI